MKVFLTILTNDVRRFFERKRLVTVGVFIFLTAVSVIPGLKSSKAEFQQVREYGQMEAKRFRELETFQQFSRYGVSFFYASSPMANLLVPQIGTMDIEGNFTDGSQLKIVTPINGAAVFGRWLSPFSPTVILFYIGMFLAMLLGADITRYREYMQHMTGILGVTKSYVYFALARMMVLSVILLASFLAMLIVILSHGFLLLLNNLGSIGAYYLTVWLCLAFALGVGLIMGSLYHGKIERILIPLAITWGVLVLMVPSFIHTLQENRLPSRLQLEADRMRILNDFKQKVYDELGEPNDANREQYRERWAGFMQNEYLQIKTMDNRVKEEVAVNNAINRKLAQLTPMSFFSESVGELCGMGRDNMSLFYEYLQEKKREYWQYVLAKVYGGGADIPEPFTEGHVFYAQSRLPVNFARGVLINLVIIVLTVFIGYFIYNRGIFHMPRRLKTDSLDLKFLPGAHMTFKVYSGHFISYVLERFRTEKRDFMLLPPPAMFPGENRVKDIIRFYKDILDALEEEVVEFTDGLEPSMMEVRFTDLESHEKALLILRLARLKPCSAYILIDMAENVPDMYLKQLQAEVSLLIDRGSLVLDFLSWQNPSWHDAEDTIDIVTAQDGTLSIRSIK